MLIKCHRPFGNFVPGDEVEVPDDAVFDAYYFEAVTDSPVIHPSENGVSE